MRQGGEPQGVQVVRQGEPTPYHCNFNPLYGQDGIQISVSRFGAGDWQGFEGVFYFLRDCCCNSGQISAGLLAAGDFQAAFAARAKNTPLF